MIVKLRLSRFLIINDLFFLDIPGDPDLSGIGEPSPGGKPDIHPFELRFAEEIGGVFFFLEFRIHFNEAEGAFFCFEFVGQGVGD